MAQFELTLQRVRLDELFRGVLLFPGWRYMEPGAIPGRLRHCEPGSGRRVSQIFGRHRS